MAASTIVTVQGINNLLASGFLHGTQYSQWYLGLFTADYRPTQNDTAASIVQNAGEITAYVENSRPQIQFVADALGGISNMLQDVEFTFTENVDVRGVFVVSSPGKGAPSGILALAGHLDSVRKYAAGETGKVRLSLRIFS